MSLSVLQQLALVIVKAVDEYTLRDKKKVKVAHTRLPSVGFRS